MTITPQKSAMLQATADNINDWSRENHLTLKTSKTNMVIFNLRTQTDLPPTAINDKDVDTVETLRQISPNH